MGERRGSKLGNEDPGFGEGFRRGTWTQPRSGWPAQVWRTNKATETSAGSREPWRVLQQKTGLKKVKPEEG